MAHGIHPLQFSLILMNHVRCNNTHIITPPKERPPLLVFLHPVVDPVLVTNLVYNINTITIVVAIIIGINSQKLYLAHRSKNRIKH